MNPPLSFSNALTQLSLLTSQAGNFTFSSDELTQALTQAWNDTYVVTQVWDGTTAYAPGTWQYPIPATVGVVRGLYFQRSTTDYPEEISPNLYDIVSGNIQFNNDMRNWLYDNYTIFIKGSYKLLTTDNLPTTNHINYVLNLAAEGLLARLLLKKTFVFLTNDTSVPEITAALNAIQSQVLRYKQALLRQFEST
jgi:hypothetical protein